MTPVPSKPPPRLPDNSLKHVTLSPHWAIDELTLRVFNRPRGPRSAVELDRIEDEVGVAAAMYKQAGWFDHPTEGYADPPPPEHVIRTRKRVTGHHYDHIEFESGYQPLEDDPAAGRWLGLEANRTAHAWIMQHHDRPRPWLVCVHGTGMGNPRMDLGLFRAHWLHKSLGLNVAFPVLTLHGPRKGGAHFPSEDALHNLHGTLQSVWDVRRVIALIRAENDARDLTMDDDTDFIGVTGISLGGLITALVGSVEPRLAAVILGAPVAKLGALIERHKGAVIDPHEAHNLVLARELDQLISPLSLPPAVAKERRFIYAGTVDRMVHSRFHAGQIWEHWGRCEALWYAGSHAGLGYSREVGRFIRHALLTSGLEA